MIPSSGFRGMILEALDPQASPCNQRTYLVRHAQMVIANQYARISQMEKTRPRRRIPGSVRRNASNSGEWCNLKNSMAVVRTAVSKGAISKRDDGTIAET